MTIYNAYEGIYGYRRIYEELVDDYQYTGSLERVRRIMKELGLQAIATRKFKVMTTDSRHNLPVYRNRLKQRFVVHAPDKAWVSDITYIRVGQKFMYLAVVLDLYSRRVIGWSMARHMKAELVCSALRMALSKRGYPKGVIVHSDRGSQYCCIAYRKLIRNHRLKGSMSNTGNCYDNAPCESFFHSFKVEWVYPRQFAYEDQARRAIFWYIEAFYNRKRRRSSIGYLSPINYENQAAKAA